MKSPKRLKQIELALQIAKLFEEIEYHGGECKEKFEKVAKLQKKLNKLEEENGTFERRPKVEFDKKKYLKLFESGIMVKDIAKEMGIAQCTLNKHVKRLGLPRRPSKSNKKMEV